MLVTDKTVIVDISQYQANKVNFDELAKAAAFVILRGQCGMKKDTAFDDFANACNERGITFGVYCYSKATTISEAKEEAKLFWKNTNGKHPNFYCMDAETEDCSAAIIRAFAETMRECGARKLGCYVAHHRYTAYNYNSVRDLFDFTWIPRYAADDQGKPNGKKPAYPCDLWQYTQKGKCAGVSSSCDLNEITGTGKNLLWFIS